MNQLRELSLFTGYGGFSLGLRLAGIQTRTVAYVEWEKYPQEIIKARIKDGFLNDAPIWGDISTLDGQQFRGMVDLITAGFPCQPHSVAGLKRGADDERNLWPETLRVIREVGPRYVILENVPGLLSASSNGGTPAYGGTVVGELAQIGYGVTWQTIGADDVGAPHRRKRWWCIGVMANTESQRNQRRPTEVCGSHGGQGGTQLWEPNITGGMGANELADSSDGRWTSEGGEQPRIYAVTELSSELESPDRGRQLADSDCNGTEWDQSQHESGGSCESMADSDGTGAGGQTRDNYTIGSLSREGSEPRLDQRGDSLGYSNINAVQGMEQGTQQSEYQRQVGLPSGEASIPTWPPSPSDADGWAEILMERPDLAPAATKEVESQFRGVADGRSHRVDELKALGNGLVPSVVAEFLRRIGG
jgi:DNA (cytosine-5)-methyltransferase 1